MNQDKHRLCAVALLALLLSLLLCACAQEAQSGREPLTLMPQDSPQTETGVHTLTPQEGSQTDSGAQTDATAQTLMTLAPVATSDDALIILYPDATAVPLPEVQ